MSSLYFGASLAPRIAHAASPIPDSSDLSVWALPPACEGTVCEPKRAGDFSEFFERAGAMRERWVITKRVTSDKWRARIGGQKSPASVAVRSIAGREVGGNRATAATERRA